MVLFDFLGWISGEIIFVEIVIFYFFCVGMDGYVVCVVEIWGVIVESLSCLKVVGFLVVGDFMFYCN